MDEYIEYNNIIVTINSTFDHGGIYCMYKETGCSTTFPDIEKDEIFTSGYPYIDCEGRYLVNFTMESLKPGTNYILYY